MRVCITGATGLLGTALASRLRSEGADVLGLSRGDRGDISWDPASSALDVSQLEGVDAFVHLAGEGIADERWSEKRKAKILDSRVTGTRLLSRSLATLSRPPRVLISASAIGYYGDRGSEICDEDTAPGSGFLPQVCLQWEAETRAAEEAGIRVVLLRVGIVLTADGGALKKMLSPFRLGAGGVIGSGDQYWSWIAMADLLEVVRRCLEDERLRGPVNAVAPSAATNREFTRALGRTLRRPTLIPVPGVAIRAAFGEMGEATILASTRVVPAKLLQLGFKFRHPELESALRAALP